MYDIMQTVNAIKNTAKAKDISITKMLSDINLSKNALSSMSNRGSWIASDSLAKIADYLGVSVDYLLGREQQSNAQISSDSRISDLISKISTLDDDQIRRLTAYVDGMIGE